LDYEPLTAVQLEGVAAELAARFDQRVATIGIVGMGYVGLPMTRAMHDAGYRVLGFDIDQAKIEALRRGEAYLKHLGQELFDQLAHSDRFEATGDPSRLSEADAVILCVPTPLGTGHRPDLQFVEASTQIVADSLRARQLVVLTSTSYPGTTREVCGPILRAAAVKQKLELGRDVFLAFSPEREDPGRTTHTTRTTPRLVGGLDDVQTELARRLFVPAVEMVIPVRSAEVAESAKLLENIYRAVNIALVNELKPALAAMGVDIWETIDAAATKPFGFQAFYPGPGLGGHCIPIDPFYLAWRAHTLGRPTRFIELAGAINSRMPAKVVDAVRDELVAGGKTLRGSRVLVMGLAYKKNVDDVRETPAAEIIRLLLAAGAWVSYHDPMIERFPVMRRYEFDLDSVAITPEGVGSQDAVLIVTDHDGVDYQCLADHARVVIDTRNAMARTRPGKAKIVKA
jgi:UDP-N-acetyl-D-glucosamine dehydrogenase